MPSVENRDTDGDDYVEGGGGNDVIFGNLGQDDLIGGTTEAAIRHLAGSYPYDTFNDPERFRLRTPEPERIFELKDGKLRLYGRESIGSWFEQALVARAMCEGALGLSTGATIALASATDWLDTYGKWTQRYGYFETRAKLPTSPGLWPAFWALGTGRWPAILVMSPTAFSRASTASSGTTSILNCS